MSLLDLITNRAGRLDRPYIEEVIVFILMSAAFVWQMIDRNISEWFTGIYVGAFVLRSMYSAYNNTKSQRTRADDPPDDGLPPVPPPRRNPREPEQ